MTVRVQVECDVEACDAKAWVTDRPDEVEPICADGTMFVLDTGWLSLPDGWEFAEGGLRCPEHA